MKARAYLLYLAFLGIGIPFLAAQSELTVLSTSASSGIDYINEQGGSSRVFAGLNLPPSGRLVVSEGRSLQLIFKDRKLEIQGPKDTTISALKAAAQAQKGSTFLGRFWKFISSSVTNTGNAKDVENYHRRYMTNTRAGIKGYATDDGEIWLPTYLSGQMSSEQVHLKWEAVQGVTAYHLVINASDNDTPILEAQTKANQFILPLAMLALQEGEVYSLTVSAVQGEEIVRSPIHYFSYVPSAKDKLLEKLGKRRAVASMTEIEKNLYFAQKLEDEELLEPAFEHYLQLLKASPDNKLIQKVFAAFLLRMNDPEKANAILGA